ncbi:MAG: hypothetical protein COU66_02035 [Candidatus Pacebacteria bacterium CG10_big_fil_rev_8_21_14_0_10_44_11]|nr:MAG: hypothetical protein COU66_02035 [Candidatus Pacebacteria bacterium CG10_big_fil_rev_8_21_14_0_10_44_11]
MLRKSKLLTGSTLIEVLIAIVVVGLVVTGVMLSISYSVRNSAESRYREVASQLAQDGMEVVILERQSEAWSKFSLRNGIYCISPTAVSLSDTAQSISTCSTGSYLITNGNKTYTRYVNITPDSGAMKAIVTIIWKSESNIDQHVEITQRFQDRAI